MPMKKLNLAGSEGHENIDNVLLEYMAALELFQRNHVKAIMPVIAPSDGSGNEFDWNLPNELPAQEHIPTVNAAKIHLRDHSSSDSIISDLDLLEGVTKIVSSVTTFATDADTQGQVSVKGVVNAILRFQGVTMDDRTTTDQVTERITAKVSDILNAGTIPKKDQPDYENNGETEME